MNQNTKMLIGAVVAAVLAIAVYYGAISQQSASSIQNQANQALGTSSGAQQTTPPTNAQTSNGTAPAAPAPNAAPATPH